MLTLFSTPKPFRGHIDVIQRNALRSWTLLHPDAEVILFGDEEGAAEVSRELGLRHEPEVRRNARGTKYLREIFERAQEVARHDVLCYVNCDIILTDDFLRAAERVAKRFPNFLMVGRRWDTDITEPLDFAGAGWAARVRVRARVADRQRDAEWIDYFVFRRGLYAEIPPLLIGRVAWDRWLIRQACQAGAAVVDASDVVVAVHQNHDYSYHPEGRKGVWEGEEAQQNYALLEHGKYYATLEEATHHLTSVGLALNWHRSLVRGRRRLHSVASQAWFAILHVTRPLRRAL